MRAESAADVDPNDQHLCLALAKALIASDDRCQVLGADRNPLRDATGKIRWVPLADAVAQRLTAMATPAPDVLAVDFDQPDDEIQAKRFDVLKGELAAAGYVPIVVASGRAGHRHLWCLIEDRDEYERLTALAKALKLGVRNKQRMRLPLGPHAEGLPVTLVSPSTPEAARRAVRRTGPTPPMAPNGLSVAPVVPLRLVQSRSRDLRPLGSRPAKTLRDGAEAGGYKTRSGAIMGIALSAVQAGWSLADLQAALADPRNAGGSKFRELGVKGPSWLATTWGNAAARVAGRPATPADPQETARLLAEWRSEALSRPWPTGTGGTDLALYLALVQAGLDAPRPTLTPAVSRHEMARRIGRKDAEPALKRLLKEGWLTEHEKGDRHKRSRWRILPPPEGETGVLSAHTGGTEIEYPEFFPLLDPGHDLFAVLGHNAWHLLAALGTDEPRSAVALAGLTGRSAKTIRNHLKPLVELGLVLSTDSESYVRSPSLDLDAAAAAVGATGLAASRAAVGEAKQRAWRARKAQEDAAVARALNVNPETGEILSPSIRPRRSTT